MADPVSYTIQSTDIALQDTAAYNERFQMLVDLRKLIQDNPDDPRAVEYESRMHNIVAEMEDIFSSDTTVANIGPLLDSWELEGGGSFGSFAPQMAEKEAIANLELIHSDSSGIDLSPEQNKQAIAGLDAKKARLDELQTRSDEWAEVHTTAKENMTSLWNRYEAIRDTDPDKDWWAESRFVWWGLADPDNAIQDEIAALGNEYRHQDIRRMQSMQPGLGSQLSRAQTDYDAALKALNNLKGE